MKKISTVKRHPGIRLKPNGKYYATKSILKKRYYKEFETLREAVVWKNQFNPLSNPVPKDNLLLPSVPVEGINGSPNSLYFRDVFRDYCEEFLPSLGKTTRHKKPQRIIKFCGNLFEVRMRDMNPKVISRHLELSKLAATDKRFNFTKDLKDLSSIFNWYSDHRDPNFSNPIRRFHKNIGKIKDIIPVEKVLTVEQLNLFFSGFTKEEELFEDLAVIQFYLAGRIQEAAALNDRTVSFKNKSISVSEKILWVKGSPTHEMGTKTGRTDTVEMNSDMEFRLLRRKNSRPAGCKYFFHHKGKILRYAMILERFNRVLKRVGLSEFSGTHILRHSMATFSRKHGGLEASQAMLRHTTARMSEHYAKFDKQEKVSTVVINAEAYFRKSLKNESEVGASDCVQFQNLQCK